MTAEHVGERVSLRRWVDDPRRGPVPGDVVGRLLAHDGEALVLVDRRGQLHVVDADRVLSSRVVPPHPRLPAEPHAGTREQPLTRDAARVLLLDADERVLLVAHVPRRDERVWTAPGGGLRPDEHHEQAAVRELEEELGLRPRLGPWIWWREVTFPFRGVWLHQRERWFLARAELTADQAPLDDVGIEEARWFTDAELRELVEPTAPGDLADRVAALRAQGPPAAPVEIGP